MYKIASHDSMSYLKPAKWWMRPFRFSDEIIESVTNEYTEYNTYINQCKELAADYLRETN